MILPPSSSYKNANPLTTQGVYVSIHKKEAEKITNNKDKKKGKTKKEITTRIVNARTSQKAHAPFSPKSTRSSFVSDRDTKNRSKMTQQKGDSFGKKSEKLCCSTKRKKEENVTTEKKSKTELMKWEI